MGPEKMRQLLADSTQGQADITNANNHRRRVAPSDPGQIVQFNFRGSDNKNYAANFGQGKLTVVLLDETGRPRLHIHCSDLPKAWRADRFTDADALRVLQYRVGHLVDKRTV